MRWTTPEELLEMAREGIQLLCYLATFGFIAWTFETAGSSIKEAINRRKKAKAEAAERARLEAWARYNDRMAILNDPDYYGD